MADSRFPPERGVELLFQELNEHLRNTEMKSIQLTVGYFGVVAIALSIAGTVHGRTAGGAATDGRLLAYGALALVGCIVLRMQVAYRGWKKHYLVMLREIIALYKVGMVGLELPNFLVPLEEQKPRDRPGADDVLTLFTALVTLGSVVLFIAEFFHLNGAAGDRVVFVVVTGALLYLLTADVLDHAFGLPLPSFVHDAYRRAGDYLAREREPGSSETKAADSRD